MPRKPTKPVKVIYRPKQVTLDMTTKHTHRMISMHRPIVKIIDYKENPDRILIGSMNRGWLKVFAYHSNPEKGFISIGEEIFAMDEWDYAKLMSLVTKLAWFCGFYGKRAKKWKIKFKNVGNRNPYISEPKKV